MVEKTFTADDQFLNDATSFVESELEKIDCSPKAMMQISICVEELFVNVAHYAYGNETGWVTISIEANNRSVLITFTDEGVPFNPLAQTDPDITLPAEERDVGGLGILMVKKSMDELNYKRSGNKNIFTMKKEI